MDLNATIARVLAGDLDAFSGIIKTYHVTLYNFTAMTFPDADQIEEIAQEVFIRAYQQLSGYDTAQPFWPWLRGIARNVVREELRAKQKIARERHAFAEAALLRAADRFAEKVDDVFDPGAQEAPALALLRECLERLSSRGRRIVRSFYEEGLTSEEIASRLDVGSSGVRNALVRIRVKLRDCVKSKLEAESL